MEGGGKNKWIEGELLAAFLPGGFLYKVHLTQIFVLPRKNSVVIDLLGPKADIRAI